MVGVTGDRDAVLELLDDTLRVLQTLSESPPPQPGARATELGQVADIDPDEASAAARAYGQAATDAANRGQPRRLDLGDPRKPNERAVTTSYAPRDPGIALFQSAMDKHLKRASIEDQGSVRATAVGRSADALAPFYKEPSGPRAADIFAKFGKLDPGWIEVVVEQAKLIAKGKHAFKEHASLTDFRFTMDDEVAVAVVGDWGGGNEAAQKVAKQIDSIKPTHVIHLGDVYYAGTPDEVRSRFLKYWPAPAQPGRSFALNSNHEMYGGGYGYFDVTLPVFKQPASYFSLANSNWRFVGLDTGYDEHDLHDPQIDWLRGQLDDKPERKTVLFSHHQLFSAYETTDTSKLRGKIAPVLDRIFGWAWGHEHLAAVYKSWNGLRAICLGNGCFPYELPTARPPQIDWLDTHKSTDPDYNGGHTFALFKINGPRIDIDFIDEDGNVLRREVW